MSIPFALQAFTIAETQLEIYVPEANAVQQVYRNNKECAYWAQVWPASVGLCVFLREHRQYIVGKHVLELGAGLGLTGLYAARTAKQVCITDREAQAVTCIQASAEYLQLSNVSAAVLNWNDAGHVRLPEVLLLSDVSYEPAVFEELQQVLEHFLRNKVQVIISTPQRLMAKAFINNLLPYCTSQWNSDVVLNGRQAGVSVFVLEHT